MEYREPRMGWPRTLRKPQGLGSKLYTCGLSHTNRIGGAKYVQYDDF